MSAQRPPALLLALLLALAGCSAQPERAERSDAEQSLSKPAESLSPRPRPDVLEALREDVAAPRHSSDGGGTAWVDQALSTPQPVTAGSIGRFVIVYEAGPEGVAADGQVFLQASSFWGWSPPQDFDADLPGYTTVSAEPADLEISTLTLGGQLLVVNFVDRGLAPGERIIFDYGAGEAGVRVDRYAEQASPIWVAVDGDGDGVRSPIAEPPGVDIVAAQPAQVILTLPSVARPGDTVRLTLAAVDLLGNAGRPVDAVLRLVSSPEGLELPATLDLGAFDDGNTTIEIAAPASGVFRVVAQSEDTRSEDEALVGVSNALFVSPKLPRMLWADLHGHSAISDGTQTPEGYFRYARDVAGLDVAALTDHDHWGMQPLALHPHLWDSIQATTAEFHQPGSFVTILGYEWTNWIHGHRHVLYFADEGPVLSSVDPAYEHPQQLWEALRDLPAMTFAHHSAGEPVPTNWDIPPDPLLEPITEVVSVHGSSEAMDSPGVLRGPVSGNFVRDALDRGYQLGFIGSGDSHDGHPGLTGLASPSSGLAALVTEDHSREGVREALMARRVYATNGPRILLHATLDDLPIGSTIEPGSEPHQLRGLIVTEQPISRIDLVRSGEVVESIAITDDTTLYRLERSLAPFEPGDYLYVRVIQIDGGAAWSSPFFAG